MLGLAARYGHLEMMRYFLAKFPADERVLIVQQSEFELLHEAVKSNHLDILEELEKYLVGDILQDFKENELYDLLIDSAANGNSVLLKRLLDTYAPSIHDVQLIENSIDDDFYRAFEHAALKGFSGVVDVFSEMFPAKIVQYLNDTDYMSFINAAQKGYQDILKSITELLGDDFYCAFDADNYAALKAALTFKHKLCVYYLLDVDVQLYEILINLGKEYEDYIFAYHLHYLNQVTIESAQDEEVIDKLRRFVVVCINMNTEESYENFEYMMTFPPLFEFILEKEAEDSLLEIALKMGNAKVVSWLMRMPAIYSAASAHNFYLDSLLSVENNEHELRMIAEDHESSTSSLSRSEQLHAHAFYAQYRTQLHRGVHSVYQQMREHLSALYEKTPAVFQLNNRTTIVLPLDWNDFCQVVSRYSLSPTQKERAMSQYYQHTIHTAYRYLSKPNHWTSAESEFSYFEPEEPEVKWSSFNDHLDLLVLYYLGAIDQSIGEYGGFDNESRPANFWQQLALIGRAHNWDRVRIRDDGAEEEYDDYTEGDMPTCNLGLKRRLFQSVQGHPLLSSLSKTAIDYGIRDFVRGYYKNAINKRNVILIQIALDNLFCCEASESDYALLKKQNVHLEEIFDFKMGLFNKFGINALSFFNYIDTRFEVSDEMPHIAKFYSEAKIDQLMVDHQKHINHKKRRIS